MTILFIFIIGLSVGSFLNVIIERGYKGTSFLSGCSKCDFCHKPLKWNDLIPLVSFILLGGKCRYCQQKISFQNPLVELITGGLFVFIYIFQNNYSLSSSGVWISAFAGITVYQFLIISGLIVIFISDLKYRIIPDNIVLFLIFVTAIFKFTNGNFLGLKDGLIAGVVAFSSFLFLVLITGGRGMGLGDVKYAFLMGILLGLPKIIVGLYLAFLTGAFISIILVIRGRKKIKSTIAFGPFLVAGTFIAFYWGDRLWQEALKMMGI